MLELLLCIGMVVTFALLLIGLKTNSVVAHLCSFLSGVILVSFMLKQELPMEICWLVMLLAFYPAYQMLVLIKEWKNL